MKNATALRVQLSDVFNRLRKGEIKHSEAAELANIAGKMIGSAKVQVEYYAMRGDNSKRIHWLESDDDDEGVGS